MMLKVLFAAVLAALACTATAQVCSGDQCLGCAGGNVTVPLLQDCSINLDAVDFSNATKMLSGCTCQCNNTPVKCEVFTGPNAALNFLENSQNGVVGKAIGSVFGGATGAVIGGILAGPAGVIGGAATGAAVGSGIGDDTGELIGR